uniref:PDZ domain-containing protein n=1 Tax=Macrostomum lignano TaxID=282301 RepID=A0A1I8FQ86_9PLAT
LNTEWTELEVIDLLNDGSGLGFASWAARARGVVVRTILSGGGRRQGRRRLCSGDHILSVGTRARSPASCASAGDQVRLIVAAPSGTRRRTARRRSPAGCCQLTPTAELDAHLADLLATMQPQLNDEEAMAEAEQQDSRLAPELPRAVSQATAQLPNSRNSAEENPEEDFENEEEKHFTVLLNRHGSRGLAHHHCGI